jgi:GH24 family phage-related lysozyme (muramidase)
VAINADNLSVDYTPEADFNGTEVITYTVSDGTLTDATGTLTITVITINDAPVAVDDTLTITEDSGLKTIDIISNDINTDADALTFTVVTAGTGTVAVNADNLSVEYTSALNFNGTEVITYIVSDGTLNDTGTLTVTVTAVNDAPVAVDDTETINEDSSLITINVIDNDTDIESDALTLAVANTSGTGTVAKNADGLSVDYTPAVDFIGEEIITYTVSDGSLTDATGTLTINVISVNVAPVGVVDSMTVTEDSGLSSTNVIDNDTDENGDTLSLTSVEATGTGTVAVNADNLSVDYTPAADFYGEESIIYTLSDGSLNETGTLIITVTNVNDAPVAVNDLATINEDSALTSINVIANDTNVDPDTLTLTAAASSGTGTLALNVDGLSVDYTPAANFNGTEVITYTVSDGVLTDATGTLTLTVTPVNDPPVAKDQSLTFYIEDVSLDVTLTATDIESDALSFAIVTNPSNGTITLDGDKATYVANAGYLGSDSFTFKVNDGNIDSANATVSISVTSNDLDNDGVLNDNDKCPNTPAGAVVNIIGCEIFTLPLSNNKVIVTSASCIGTSDGSMKLSVENDNYDYYVTITGKDDVTMFGDSKTKSVSGLSMGTYNVCFYVLGINEYKQCFKINIKEPKALSAFLDVDNDKKTTSIQLAGSLVYNIEVNGEDFEVKGDNFTTSLPTGLSIIKISTNLDCQGVIEKEVFLSEDIHYYPNPTPSDVSVHVSGEDTKILVSVFSEKGDLIYSKEQQIQNFSRKTNIDLSKQITGVYIVIMESKTVRKTFKIVRM